MRATRLERIVRMHEGREGGRWGEKRGTRVRKEMRRERYEGGRDEGKALG